MIDTKDISVVVQGSVDNRLTPRCITSIRKYLPNAKIILSTWKGTILDNLDYDILIENSDPGAKYLDSFKKIQNNVNRQILSTKTGLQKVTTPFVLKIRSDMEIVGDSFLRSYDTFPARSTQYKFLQSRLIISNFYTARYDITHMLFHPSDWITFGLYEDVSSLWDIELAQEPEMSQYFCGRSKNFMYPDPMPSWNFRYIPEQYICILFIRKFIHLEFQHYLDYSEEKCETWKRILANNFIVLDYDNQLDIHFRKYNPHIHSSENQMSHLLWLKLYEEYCNE
jgi:hypothetical protein